jgi:hypothetical protein
MGWRYNFASPLYSICRSQLTLTYKEIIIVLELWFLDKNSKFGCLCRGNALVLYHMAEDAFLTSYERTDQLRLELRRRGGTKQSQCT